jgi:hypothetical protein
MKASAGNGCMSPRFRHDFGTSSWVVNFTPHPLRRHPSARRLDGPHNQLGRREEETILDSAGTWSLSRCHSLYRLRYPGSEIAIMRRGRGKQWTPRDGLNPYPEVTFSNATCRHGRTNGRRRSTTLDLSRQWWSHLAVTDDTSRLSTSPLQLSDPYKKSPDEINAALWYNRQGEWYTATQQHILTGCNFPFQFYFHTTRDEGWRAGWKEKSWEQWKSLDFWGTGASL